jgi:hypothetical protein
MICTIMQPTYLPWAGYFNLISQADIFVFLDDAQLQKNSWHNRNRILVNHAPHWITVPVKHVSLDQTIKRTEIDNNRPWRKKHIKLIQQTYCKHPFVKDILGILNCVDQENFSSLSDLNIALVKWIIEKLTIKTKIFLSSQMELEGKRTARIVEILNKLNADTYLSPKGANDYLEADCFIDLTSTVLTFQQYNPAPYAQYMHNGFESHLSIVDVVANMGWDAAREYIR